MSYELQFEDKTVLVVGGSSGIGNAIAQAFRLKGASVHIWGTRASADDYANSEDSDLRGLSYRQIDVSQREQLWPCEPDFERLDVLVLSQGIVLYGGVEFDPERFREVVDVNLNSRMECCARCHS